MKFTEHGDSCTGYHGTANPVPLDRIRCPYTVARKRELWQRQRQTPGTYRYNEAHGIGVPGIKQRYGNRRRKRSAANIKDIAMIKELTNGTTV